MFQKQEDFHYLLKYLFLKDLPENNNALFIGRLQPPSKMHIEIIREGLREYNRVIVAIVKGKKSDIDDNPFSFATQQEILRAAFPKEERLEIIQVATGNLFSAIEKSKRNVNAVLCGEDRANTYSAQLLQNPEIRIVRFLRDMNGVSGTKLREALKNNDKTTFVDNVDSSVVKFYDKLKSEICKR
jgi:nicotinamide mononucleotide adenylyltransferase